MKNIINLLKEKLHNKIFVIAVSTGADSMCLLDLCLQAGLKDNLIIAHCNHNLRIESNEEEAFIIQYGAQKGVKIECKHLNLENIHSNIEASARFSRYEFFKEVINKYHAEYLLLAHNADDNLETIIMRFLKSSSVEGYAGIKEESFIDGITYYRPLLHKSKNEIYEYVNNNHIPYYEDHTNQSNDYLRNRIRHKIVPLLKEENPNIYEAVDYYNEQLLGVSELLNNEFTIFKDNHVKTINEDHNLITYFDYQELNKLGSFLRKQVLFNVIKKYNPTINIINQIIDIIDSTNNKIISTINDQLTIIKEYGLIYFVNHLNQLDYQLVIDKEGRYELPNQMILEVNKNSCHLFINKQEMCYNDIRLPITIRSRNNGDKMVRNSKKGTFIQSVSDIMTNQKIPTIKRNNLLLLCEGEMVRYILGYKIK